MRYFKFFLLITIFLFEHHLFGQEQEYISGEIIVKLKGKSSSKVTRGFAKKMSSKMNLKASFRGMNIHSFSISKDSNVYSAIDELKQDPEVEYAEPNFIVKKFQVQAMSNAAVYSQSNSRVQATEAWGIMTSASASNEAPIVAIVDTGVFYKHKVFKDSGAMWINSGEIPDNGIDDDDNGYVDDIYGWNFRDQDNNVMDGDSHGTHIAGVVLGAGQDIFASPPEPAKVRLMALKFLGADGSGSTSDAISAIHYAVDNGAQVINNSWGGASYSQALWDALLYAYEHKIVIVTAAGNSSKNNDTTAMYPANYDVPSLISVAATTDFDTLAVFSNYGKNKVHIGAPGVSILSTIPSATEPYNSFQYMTGTSMAAPFIAGLAALMLREAPNLTGFQVKNILTNSGDIASDLVNKVISGTRVNTYQSVLKAKGENSTLAYQPTYVKPPEGGDRSIASSEEKKTIFGCGTVASVGNDRSSSRAILVIIFSLLPLFIWFVVKAKIQKSSRRKYDRFVMTSDLRIVVGGRELSGSMKTISAGGLSFEANEMIEKGGVVSLQISSPDGREQLQVQGHVVWNDIKNIYGNTYGNAYGIQFDRIKDNVKSIIQKWTRDLVKVSS